MSSLLKSAASTCVRNEPTSQTGDVVPSPPKEGRPQEERGQWGKQLDFFLSCLGYAVGLGNVWRFPYLCYRNGGGAFLVPYLIMLALCGLPMFFFELALGQYHGQGPNLLFLHLAPAFQGIGYAMLVVSTLVLLYYNMIIAWSFFYLFASFSSILGWSSCDHEWNTPACFVTSDLRQCDNQTMNDTLLEGSTANCKMQLLNGTERISSSEDFFLHYMLGISAGIDEFGSLNWRLVLCLLLAWIVVALCLIKGVHSSGKVVYFTALFPYVVLVILLFRGATLEGAADGIYFYIIPDWEKLKNSQAWGDAAMQIFYSLGPGFGGLLTLASYNKYHNNCHRDAILIAFSNCGTSIFAGFVIFSILGSMAYNQGVPVDQVVKSGPGLAFIAYPEAVLSMPVSPLWSILFFFMLITLGLDSQFTMCETIITAAQDEWPWLRKKKSSVALIFCSACFFLGLPFCAEGGIYLFTIVDWYAGGWTVLIISLCEIIIVFWIYGIENFQRNIKDMIGHDVSCYWAICWKYLTPMTIIGILIFSFVNYEPASFGKYLLPAWANALGFLMVASAIVMIPLFGIYQFYLIKKERKEFCSAFRPMDVWGPAEEDTEFEKAQELTDMAGNLGKLESINGEMHLNKGFVVDEEQTKAC